MTMEHAYSWLLSWPEKPACPAIGLPAVVSCPGYRACIAAGRQTGKVPICSDCYACHGRYSMTHVQDAQYRRWEWWRATSPARRAVVLADVIASTGYSYFRGYDSGDMCRGAEETWLDVATALSDVRFWFPTRTWTDKRHLAKLRRLASLPNVVVRPSALCFNDRPPHVAGLAAGTTAVDGAARIAEHHCTGDCEECGRLCWLQPWITVEYERH